MTKGPGPVDPWCPVNTGDFNPSLANEQSPYATGIRQRYDVEGGEASLGCPTQVMHQWAKEILQGLEDKSGNESAILALDPHSPILLRGNAWLAYDRIKGLTGGLVGYSTNEPQLVDDTYQMQLSVGGALVASHMGAPLHWLPAVVYSRWQELGGPSSCLSTPISDPHTDGASFKQDFTSGLFSLSTVTGTMTYEGDTC